MNTKPAFSQKYIDLHLHLDGAVTVEIARKLALLQNITLPASDDRQLEKLLRVPDDCEDLNDFLKCFALPLTLLQTREGIREAVRLVICDEQKSGAAYAEVRFAPQLHTQRGLNQRQVIEAALEGLKSSPIPANLILCCMRGEGNEAQNDETVLLAKKFLTADGGVVAVDLAGAEALFSTAKYRPLFEKAKRLGIPFTIHAGEADGPESVRLAVEYGAARIGHGVRITEDPAVLELVRQKGIFLEMCPTSNRQTRAVTDMSRYPLAEFLNKGILATVNTDDPAIEDTDIAREYAYVQSLLGLTEEQKTRLLQNAVQAAFTVEAVRERLRKELGLNGES